MSVLLREAIGDSIRRARTERRRTLRDVSRDARVSLGYLSEIERGRKEPSSELLAAICDALAVTLPDLLDEAADTMRPAAARRAVDPRLRSAVEEAFGPAVEVPADTGGDAVTDVATGSPTGAASDAATARAVAAASSRASDPTLPPDALAGDEDAGLDGVLDGLAVGDRAGAPGRDVPGQALPGTVSLIARLPVPGAPVRVAA